MTPERRRAHERVQLIRLHVPSEVVDAMTSAFEELEHLRPLLEIGRAVVNARSGHQRALALGSLSECVAKLGAAGV